MAVYKRNRWVGDTPGGTQPFQARLGCLLDLRITFLWHRALPACLLPPCASTPRRSCTHQSSGRAEHLECSSKREIDTLGIFLERCLVKESHRHNVALCAR